MKTIIQITLLTIILVGCKTSKNITTSPDNLKGIIVNYNARKTSKGSYKPDTIPAVTYGKHLTTTEINATADTIYTTGYLYSEPTGTILNTTRTIPDPIFLDYKSDRKLYWQSILWFVIPVSLFVIIIIASYLTPTKKQ